MVSLSELESIFITLRLMDADQVYQNKQVLVVFDVKFLFDIIKQYSTNLVYVAKARNNRGSDKTTKEEQRIVKIW